MTDHERPGGTTKSDDERRGLARDERRARLMISVGAVLLFGGIALAVTEDDTGRWLIVAGVVTLFVALHRFGRLGPEDATS